MYDDYVLTLCCPDRTGIVAAVSHLIAQHQGWITEADQHSDVDSGRFFMRVQIKRESLTPSPSLFETAFADLARDFQMSWNLVDGAKPKKVVILVSKFDHCLVELLYRWRTQDFRFEIPCVISNHADLRKYVEDHGIVFHHIPIRQENKAEDFAKTFDLFEQYQGDVIVLARYMQIIPPEICQRYPNQIINIHHSFLPSFVGAKPYHQAYQRGVKLIGATCHYVTPDLDAGPIIEQDVARVSHRDCVEDMVRLGRDVEKMVLTRGLRNHVEDRVIAFENKTIIMD